METALHQLTLSDEEDDSLTIPPSSAPCQSPFDLCLVGMFLTYNCINFVSMKETLADLWHPLAGISISDLGAKRILFRFYAAVDMDRVLDGTPWLFNRHLLLLRRINPGEEPLHVPLIFTEVWVVVRKLRPGYMTELVARGLGDFIGSFLAYDPTVRKNAHDEYVLRIRVQIDTTKPLRRKKKIVDPDGSMFYALFSYERIFVFCFLCGKLGHTDSFCDLLLHHKREELKPMWDESLRAVGRRTQRPTSSWLRSDTTGPPILGAPTSVGLADGTLGVLPSQSFRHSFLCGPFPSAPTFTDTSSTAGAMDTDWQIVGHGSPGPEEDDPMAKPTDPKKRPRFKQTPPTPFISATTDLDGGHTQHSTVEPSPTKVDRRP
ncbi:hypothetical protein K2173_019340 [Erythroxylum novogranatense]|uniref:CCHC-type domain-containing protein n=1 Tax=Erythroxylum novogranatense TaxID=1862640 RepID=A0AAV8STA7_9ROSI|nr:hypothetical protein K2173_019340 [Erythroxylum novogranatense]